MIPTLDSRYHPSPRVRLARVKLTIPGFDGRPLRVVVELPCGTAEAMNWSEGVRSLILCAKRDHVDKRLAPRPHEDVDDDGDADEDDEDAPRSHVPCVICGKPVNPYNFSWDR